MYWGLRKVTIESSYISVMSKVWVVPDGFKLVFKNQLVVLKEIVIPISQTISIRNASICTTASLNSHTVSDVWL